MKQPLCDYEPTPGELAFIDQEQRKFRDRAAAADQVCTDCDATVEDVHIVFRGPGDYVLAVVHEPGCSQLADRVDCCKHCKLAGQ